MKKTTKGALAAGAAAVLLAGGAGTYAAWSSSGDAVPGGEVTAGHLRISQVEDTGAWHWETAAGAVVGAGETIVPGDVVVYVADYTLDIKGTNLRAEAELTGTAGVSDVGTPSGLAAELQVGAATVTGAAGVDLENLSETDSGTITVETPVTFDPKIGVGNQAGMDGKASLSNVGVVLKQTAPATA
ncbi:alternate-type signal peptide domain-containing protein [Dietzia sp. NPDC055343]